MADFTFCTGTPFGAPTNNRRRTLASVADAARDSSLLFIDAGVRSSLLGPTSQRANPAPWLCAFDWRRPC